MIYKMMEQLHNLMVAFYGSEENYQFVQARFAAIRPYDGILRNRCDFCHRYARFIDTAERHPIFRAYGLRYCDNHKFERWENGHN